MVYMEEMDEVKEFAKRAAKKFADNNHLSTYTDDVIEPGCLFAVRWGLGNNCVVVFRLDEDFEPINFQELIRDY